MTFLKKGDGVSILPKKNLVADRSLLIGRQTSKWSLWDVFFDENNTRTDKRILFGYNNTIKTIKFLIRSQCQKT